MHTLVLSTGSNLGDRRRNLELARSRIGEKIGPVRLASGIYESASWGYSSDHSFYNQCLEVLTELDTGECIERILETEREMGRERDGCGYSDRVIDIDILFYDQLVIQSGNLTIPHKSMHERRFVLQPLAEILPGYEHPVYGVTISELLERCSDPHTVRRIK
jgi:2-amino-4-hydroxy-6-hydroxymethyldihydropteridine diphosphokinase